MPKAGYCKECKKNVWLKEDGSCQFGHSASSISNVYEGPWGGELKRSFLDTYRNLIIGLLAAGLVFFLASVGIGIYAIYEYNQIKDFKEINRSLRNNLKETKASLEDTRSSLEEKKETIEKLKSLIEKAKRFENLALKIIDLDGEIIALDAETINTAGEIIDLADEAQSYLGEAIIAAGAGYYNRASYLINLSGQNNGIINAKISDANSNIAESKALANRIEVLLEELKREKESLEIPEQFIKEVSIQNLSPNQP